MEKTEVDKVQMLTMLEGKRTYLMAVGLLFWAILGFALNKSDMQGTIVVVLQALALMGIRASIKSPKL